MVVGVGIDIVDVARIEQAMKNEKFVRRILTEREEAYCTTPMKVAGRWAAKEAIIKAIGVTVLMKNIEIWNDQLGQPHVTINDASYDGKRLKIFISITHEKTHAAAVAVVERSVLQIPM